MAITLKQHRELEEAKNARADILVRKWGKMLEARGKVNVPKIKNARRKRAMAFMLENTEAEALKPKKISLFKEAVPANNTSNVATYNPALTTTLVRRAWAEMVPYEIGGVQPMETPNGLVFALTAKYDGKDAMLSGDGSWSARTGMGFLGSQAGAAGWGTVAEGQGGGAESFGVGLQGSQNFDEGYTGSAGYVPVNGPFNFAGAVLTAAAEGLGTGSGNEIPEVDFDISSVSVTARTRKLKAVYTPELAQDLESVHSLNAADELTNILSGKINQDVNREFLYSIVGSAVPGGVDVVTKGYFDMSNTPGDVKRARWLDDAFKTLVFQIDREANQIQKDTRIGRGNFLIVSADVASALNATGYLSYPSDLIKSNLEIDSDIATSTFAGVLNGKYRVYIEPFLQTDFVTIGFKGDGDLMAGMIYAPYVPLATYEAVDPRNGHPTIGFSTRYAIVSNPFAGTEGKVVQDTNPFFRRLIINNLAGSKT